MRAVIHAINTYYSNLQLRSARKKQGSGQLYRWGRNFLVGWSAFVFLSHFSITDYDTNLQQRSEFDAPSQTAAALAKLQSQAFIPNAVRDSAAVSQALRQHQQSQQQPEGGDLPLSPECQERRIQADEWCKANNGYQRCRSHVREIILPPTTNSSSMFISPCKTLWFAGFSEGAFSRCRDANNTMARGIRMEYAAALASAKRNADTVLQPVLLLGRLGLEDDQDVSGVRSWALEQGAIVIIVNRLSIQDEIAHWHRLDDHLGHDHLMGPYLRMDIPLVSLKHGLFDLPSICPRHVLYTDADALFVNPLTHNDMNALKSFMVNREVIVSTIPWWNLIRWWKLLRNTTVQTRASLCHVRSRKGHAVYPTKEHGCHAD